MKPQEVYRIFVDSINGPLGERFVATCDRYPTLEYRAADDEHARAGLLRLIADAIESGLL